MSFSWYVSLCEWPANWHWTFYALSLKLSPSLHVNDYRRVNCCNNRFLSVLSVRSECVMLWAKYYREFGCNLTAGLKHKRNKTPRKWVAAGDNCKAKFVMNFNSLKLFMKHVLWRWNEGLEGLSKVCPSFKVAIYLRWKTLEWFVTLLFFFSHKIGDLLEIQHFGKTL